MNDRTKDMRALTDGELRQMLHAAANRLGADAHALDGALSDMDAVRKMLASLPVTNTEDRR